MKKLLLITCLSFLALIVVIRSTKDTVYLYNAYSPAYDEFFVIKSYTELAPKSTVWFNDKAVAVNYPTPFVAQIQSVYKIK